MTSPPADPPTAPGRPGAGLTVVRPVAGRDRALPCRPPAPVDRKTRVRSRRPRGRWVVTRDLHGGETGATGRTVPVDDRRAGALAQPEGRDHGGYRNRSLPRSGPRAGAGDTGG